MPEKEKFFSYKGKPLVRCGNEIYYGNMSDKYVILLQILESKTVEGMEVATKVLVQLLLTDTDIKASSRVVKKSEKGGLYDALDIGSIWLERALGGGKVS